MPTPEPHMPQNQPQSSGPLTSGGLSASSSRIRRVPTVREENAAIMEAAKNLRLADMGGPSQDHEQ
jgi:hypothetical protein